MNKMLFFVVFDFLKWWLVIFGCFLFSQKLFLGVSSSLKCCFLAFRVLRNIVPLVFLISWECEKAIFHMLREHVSVFHTFWWIQQSRTETDNISYRVTNSSYWNRLGNTCNPGPMCIWAKRTIYHKRPRWVAGKSLGVTWLIAICDPCCPFRLCGWFWSLQIINFTGLIYMWVFPKIGVPPNHEL